MKTRHQRGDTHPLTLDEILDETQHLDIGMKQKQWLMSEALVNNPKIDIIDGKYAFKPKYNLKDKKALLRLLDKHDQRGLGGILLEDIEEGLPNAQKAIKALGDQIIFVTRPDKKKILFYNDKSCQFTVDEGNYGHRMEVIVLCYDTTLGCIVYLFHQWWKVTLIECRQILVVFAAKTVLYSLQHNYKVCY
ncbi:hypothetical protein GDO81_000893 [Engystomops pustulosus]|uniref:TFIIE beta domain-containing protein n=1 Tax=Engystomops pustulosus TaxID=76066 RepID=A0AAV7D822_ENGPU|nr:hypothetical protein GDO81_000893 [Engystomops pustulosus]